MKWGERRGGVEGGGCKTEVEEREGKEVEGREGAKAEGKEGTKCGRDARMIVLTGSTVIPCQEECYGIAVLSDLDFNILWQSVLLKDVNDKLEPSCTKELLAKVLC